jgi:hypothetical protein
VKFPKCFPLLEYIDGGPLAVCWSVVSKIQAADSFYETSGAGFNCSHPEARSSRVSRTLRVPISRFQPPGHSYGYDGAAVTSKTAIADTNASAPSDLILIGSPPFYTGTFAA